MVKTTIQSGNDVITFLKSQHAQVKTLFAAVLDSTGSEREKLFYKLRRTLAVHETAEEEVVHPAARRALANGEQIVMRRLEEENHAKVLLTELEQLDLQSPAFETKLRALRAAVLAHAEAEENEEFHELVYRLDSSHLNRMKKAAELAEAVAPTRPHPGVESQATNLLAGPFAAMMDRTRDALTGKS